MTDFDWTAVATSGMWLLGIFIVISLLSNFFGLFNRTYKGRWIKVKYVSLPELSKRLSAVNGFKGSDGMQIDLECKLVEEIDRSGQSYYCSVKIPEYVFHSVEHEVILKELGIK